jgi:hypothetical protein
VYHEARRRSWRISALQRVIDKGLALPRNPVALVDGADSEFGRLTVTALPVGLSEASSD